MIKYINIEYPGFKHFDKIPKLYKLTNTFEKDAYETADATKAFIDSLKPTKDSNYYLINAMGAGEVYGSNSRGDYFSRAELKANHHTFVDTPAMAYIQHQNKNPEYSLGKVAFSNYNDETDRVELVERIDWPLVHKYAPSWLNYALQRGEQVNTSMGTKIAYDECSLCGNRAKYASEYCDHARYHMNQFIGDKHIHVKNYGPIFFDNSFVKKGADRTARVLTKVAGEENYTITSDKDFREYFPGIDIIEAPSKIAEIVKEEFDTVPEFTKEYMKSFSEFDIEDILGTTKMAGIDLSPSEYQYIVLNGIGLEKEAEDYYDANKVFELKNDKPQQLSLKLNYDVLEKLADAVYDRSDYRPFVFYRNQFKVASSQSPKKTTFGGELAEILSKGYISYHEADLTKEAGLIENILLSLFLTLPEMIKLKASKDRVDTTQKININAGKQISKSKMLPTVENTNIVNPLPVFVSNAPMYEMGRKGFYNPLYKNPFLEGKKEASLRGLARTAVPLTAGIGSTLYMAGKERERQETGDQRAGTGPMAFAKKHPFITAGSIALGTGAITRKLVKKAEGVFNGNVSEYKDYLASISNEKLLSVINNIPDNVFNKLVE